MKKEKQKKDSKATKPQIKKILKPKSVTNNNMCMFMTGRPVC